MTFEVTNLNSEQRQYLRNRGYRVESLGTVPGDPANLFYNVSCDNDEDSDTLVERLEAMGKEPRMI
jgi:hypothetical protein